MFYGGFGTNWQRARRSFPQAALLSTVGVALTAALVMLFCHFALRMGWLRSLLMGSVISSTDAASVFNILRSRHLNLRYHTAPLLELESGSNDPTANILVLFSLTLLRDRGAGGEVVVLLLEQFGFGLIVGFAMAGIVVWVMQHVPTAGEGYGVIFVIAAALGSYAAASCLGGNGYLSVYITGIVMGNSAIPGRKALVHFFDGMTGLMQVLIFFLLGLISTPSMLLQCAGTGIVAALFLTFMARPIVVFALLKPFRAPIRQRLVVEWCGMRGASAVVFAIVAALDPATGAAVESRLFHTVFFIVLFSILLQGSLIPLVTKKLDMIDEHDDVMRTFSDWSDETALEFIQIPIAAEHPWCGHLLMEIRPSLILGGGRVVTVVRDGVQITPRGSTRIQAGDIVVASGGSVDGQAWGTLNELTISRGHAWAGKHVSELTLDEDSSLVAIYREGSLLIPDGSTLLCAGDRVVINENSGPQPKKEEHRLVRRARSLTARARSCYNVKRNTIERRSWHEKAGDGPVDGTGAGGDRAERGDGGNDGHRDADA